MPQPLPLPIEFKSSTLPGLLHAPEGDPPSEGLAAVVICDDPLSEREAAEGLIADIADSLCEAGLVVAHIDRNELAGQSERPDDLDAGELVDQASALFHAVALREDVDIDRIGVLGYSLGAIIAMCLTRRTDRIARLCLLSPRTADHVAAELTRNNGSGGSKRSSVPAPRLVETLAGLAAESDRTGGNLPTLIVHGAADRAVPPELSLVYLEAAGRSGPRPEHILIAQGDHGYNSPQAREACLDQILQFLDPLIVATGTRK